MIAIKTRGQSRHQPPMRLPRNHLDVCCGWPAREAMRPGMEQRELRKDKTKHEANVRRFDGGKLFRGAVWVRSLPEHLRQPPKANAAVSMPGCTAVDARALPPRARGQLEAQRSVSCKSNREAVVTITEIMRASTRRRCSTRPPLPSHMSRSHNRQRPFRNRPHVAAKRGGRKGKCTAHLGWHARVPPVRRAGHLPDRHPTPHRPHHRPPSVQLKSACCFRITPFHIHFHQKLQSPSWKS